MRRLRNAEHFDFYDLVCIQIAGKVLQCEILLSEWNIFRGAFEKENNIYKRYVKQNYTRLVRKAHADRKRSYVGLKLLVEAALYNSSPMVQPAAEELMTVLKNHPGIYRAPMSEASAMILNLVQDIKRTKYASSVALVGVADAIGRLNQDNENFMTLFFDRAYSKEEAKLEGRLREVRRLVDCGFARLVNMINALCQINEIQHPPIRK